MIATDMLNLSLTLDSAPLDNALLGLQSSLGGNSAAFAAIAQDFHAMVAGQFATQGSAGGTPWAPLAPSTRRRRDRAGAPLLDVTGALRNSLTDSGAPGSIEEISGDSLLIGTTVPYASFHQYGAGWGLGSLAAPAGRQQGRGLPMRPLIVVTDERLEAWREIFQENLLDRNPLLGPAELGGTL
jgi:phage gpG-like protein